MKSCFKCHETKPFSEFYKHSETVDGYLGKCKTCTKRDAKSYNKTYCQIVTGGNPRSDWRKRNPKAYRAHSLVNSALKSGKLEKGKCKCGSENVHAHHEDYNDPLNIVWLCPQHHKDVHGIPF